MTQALSIKIIPSITGLVCFLSSSLAIAGCQPQVTAQACQTKAYVIDKDPQGLNVRKEPNSEGEIIGTLPLYTEVDVFKYQDNWFFVAPIDPELQGVDFKGEGWVYASLLGLNTRGYDNDSVSLYAEPNETSDVLGHVESSSAVTMISCSGEWVKVRQESLEGWLEPEEQCAAALTSCS